MNDDPGEVLEDIEQTRGRLESTLEALSYKTDVAARAEETAMELTVELSHRLDDAKRVAAEAAGDFASDVGDRARVLGHETGDRAKALLDRANETATTIVDGVTPSHVARAGRRGILRAPLVLALVGLAGMLAIDTIRTGPRVSPDEA